MLTRIIVGVVLSALILTMWLLGGFWLQAVFYLALVISAYEMISSLAKANIKVHVLPCAAFILALPFALILARVNGILLALFFAVLVMFVQLIITSDTDIRTIAATAFTLVYPLCLISTLYAMLANGGEAGRMYVLLVIVVAAVTDTAAYFTGSFFGKTKFAPSISPKKTVEGCLGGVIGGLAGAMILYLILSATTNPQGSFGMYFTIGLLGSVVGQIGDLAASLIKRGAGVKDYGTIFPGHGGVLDRLDSIMFISAMVYTIWSVQW